MSDEVIADVVFPTDGTDVLRTLAGLTEQDGVITNITETDGQSIIRLSFPDDDSLKRAHEGCIEQGVTMNVRRLTHMGDSDERTPHPDHA